MMKHHNPLASLSLILHWLLWFSSSFSTTTLVNAWMQPESSRLLLLTKKKKNSYPTTLIKPKPPHKQQKHPLLAPSLSSLTASKNDDGGSGIAINPLVSSIKPSKTVEIFSLVKQMQSEGTEVTSLCVGEPDFLPPPQVLQAATDAISAGETRYTALTGILELRKAIANDLRQRKGVTYDPLTEIIVGNGAKQSVYQGILALCGVGDSVIVPAPYWPSYPEMVALAGAAPIILETKSSNGYLVTPEDLREALAANNNIKMMILCNPSNPTGGVYNRKQLGELADVLKEYPQVSILADEIYEQLVYTDDEDSDGDSCPSFASIPGMFPRTLTVNGFSKAYAMTGMRLGYVACPAPIAKAITTIQSQFTSCAGSVSQLAGVAALTNVDKTWLDDNVVIMKQKRDFVLEELSKMPNVNVEVPPKGAFYVMPNVESYFDGNDTKLCLKLLQEKQLALVPGSSFGAPGTVRISYATGMEELETAMTKLKEFLEEEQQQESSS